MLSQQPSLRLLASALLGLAVSGLGMVAAPSMAAAQQDQVSETQDELYTESLSILAGRTETGGYLRGSVGVLGSARFGDEPSGPYWLGGIELQGGMRGDETDGLSVHSRTFVQAGSDAASDEGLRASGRHALSGYIEIAGIDGTYLDLDARGELIHSGDGLRGVRPRLVGPAAFHRESIAPTLWITRGDLGEDGERIGEDHWGVAIDYGLEHTAYQSTPDQPSFVARRVTHRAGLGAGLRSFGRDHRGEVRFGNVSIAATQQDQLGEVLTSELIEVGLFDTRFVFADRGGERAAVGAMIGWGLLWRDRPLAADLPKEGSHSPIGRVQISYDTPEVGRLAMSLGNQLATTPDQGRALGVAHIDLIAGLHSDEFPAAFEYRVNMSHVYTPREDLEPQWQVQMRAESYAKLWKAEIGISGGGGYGPRTGSIGWDPFSGGQRWEGQLGGFVRFANEWFEVERDGYGDELEVDEDDYELDDG